MNNSPYQMNPMTQAKPVTHPERFTATDSCVMCGLCLPHCPTYLETGHEADSPRGRIALIQAMARGELEADQHLISHLDGCLVCRACEDMCPSRVPYGDLIISAREELYLRHPRKERYRLLVWFLRRFTHSRRFRKITHRILKTVQSLPGRTGEKKSGSQLARLQDLVPPLRDIPLPAMKYDPHPHGENTVQLFTGCASEVFARETLAASREVLEHLGFRVLTPPAQTCCGALALHAGNRTEAIHLANQNISAFKDNLPILGTASGCTATLKDAAHWHGADAIDMAGATEDICTFLQRADWSGISLRTIPLRVAVHVPCTLKHTLHADAAVIALLKRMPGLDIIDLSHHPHCCGAAGRYMIDNPKMADALADNLITALFTHAPDMLVTSNIGCAMHIQAAMRRAGRTLEVTHPVCLLAAQFKPLADNGTVA